MKKNKVATVILNYNTWNETINCIESIKSTYSNMMFLIVDNCSKIEPTKKFLDYIKENSDVKFFKAKKNNGYSSGNNIGIKYAIDNDFDYIFISNSDIIVKETTIQNMITLCEEKKDCGIVGPQIYDAKGMFLPFLLCCKQDFSGKIKNMMLKIPIINKLFDGFKKAFIISHEIDEPVNVFGVHGSFFLMTNECAKYLYPLDERTFLYEEEYIIGCRLEESRFSAFLCPKTMVYHLEGISTKGMSPFAFECLTNSEQLYISEYLDSNLFQSSVLFIIRRLEYLLFSMKNRDYRNYKRLYFRNTSQYRKNFIKNNG